MVCRLSCPQNILYKGLTGKIVILFGLGRSGYPLPRNELLSSLKYSNVDRTDTPRDFAGLARVWLIWGLDRVSESVGGCGGRPRIDFGGGNEVCADGILVDVGLADFELGSVADAVVGEASLPDRLDGGDAVGEASFDQAYGALKGDGLRGEEKVNVIGHDDEGVEFVVAFGSIVLEGFEEEFGVAVT